MDDSTNELLADIRSLLTKIACPPIMVLVCESNSMLETVFESLATPTAILAGAKAALALAAGAAE